MFKKTIALIGLTAAMTFSAAANAAYLPLYGGTIDFATGPLASLTPPGTEFTGYLDWNYGSGTLVGGQVLLGGFCFTDDASGSPPTSPTCGGLAAVPILASGQTVYDGTPAAPGSTFEQAGTTFDGTSGIINILTFSPTFNVEIPIALDFNADGTYIDDPSSDTCLINQGSLFADAGALGTVSGSWSVVALQSCDEYLSNVPIPAAAWLFGSALLGLGFVKRNKAGHRSDRHA